MVNKKTSQNVTLEEFKEDYNNISCNIDDDKLFEHVIVTWL